MERGKESHMEEEGIQSDEVHLTGLKSLIQSTSRRIKLRVNET